MRSAGSVGIFVDSSPGDLVTRVDDVWTPDDETLFAALSDRRVVTVQILRHGLPHTYAYRLEP